MTARGKTNAFTHTWLRRRARGTHAEIRSRCSSLITPAYWPKPTTTTSTKKHETRARARPTNPSRPKPPPPQWKGRNRFLPCGVSELLRQTEQELATGRSLHAHNTQMGPWMLQHLFPRAPVCTKLPQCREGEAGTRYGTKHQVCPVVCALHEDKHSRPVILGSCTGWRNKKAGQARTGRPDSSAAQREWHRF